MRYMAFVGKPQDRYQAEKTFTTGPGIDGVKTFNTIQEFLEEVKRENNTLVTVIVCVPDPDLNIAKFRQQVHYHEPAATIIESNSY